MTIENKIILFSSALIFYFILKILKRKGKYYSLFLIALPATLFHELAHYVISYITFGKPVKFSIIPKKEENGWTLGYVSSTNLRWDNQALVALAPFLLLPGMYYVLEYAGKETIWYFLCVYGYILANFLHGAIPSSVDFKLAFKKPIPIICLIVFIIYEKEFIFNNILIFLNNNI